MPPHLQQDEHQLSGDQPSLLLINFPSCLRFQSVYINKHVGFLTFAYGPPAFLNNIPTTLLGEKRFDHRSPPHLLKTTDISQFILTAPSVYKVCAVVQLIKLISIQMRIIPWLPSSLVSYKFKIAFLKPSYFDVQGV